MSFTYESKPLMPGQFRERLAELCAVRDGINAKNAGLETELEIVNGQIEALRRKAMGLAEQIDDNRGRENWIALKKDIRILASSLSGKV